MSRDPEAALPPYFSIAPDAALAELGPPVGTRDFAAIAEACARGRADLAARGLGAGGGQAAAAVLDLGDHPLPDPARPRRTSAGCCAPTPTCPRAAPKSRGGQGGARWFTLDEVLQAARPLRRRGQPLQGVPALAPGGPAGQGRRGRQLQGRRRQDLDRRAPRDVGGARRLPGAGRRPRQPGLDDLAVRRPGRRRMGHGVPADRPRLRARPARGEPPPRRARRPGPAARRDAGDRARPRPPPT